MGLWLAYHLLGAGITAGLLGASVINLACRQSSRYAALSRWLWAMLGVQTATGLGLALASGASRLGTCLRLGAYLAVVAAAQGALAMGTRAHAQARAASVAKLDDA